VGGFPASPPVGGVDVPEGHLLFIKPKEENVKYIKKWASMLTVAILVVTLCVLVTQQYDIQIAKSQALPFFWTLKISTKIVGTSNWRGQHSFAWRGAPTQALYDTVYVKGTLPTDYVFVQRTRSRSTPAVFTEVNQLKGYTTGIYGIASTDTIYVSRQDTLVADSLYNYMVIR